MARRHRSLVLLSHDHHHGLALALRLKQGDKALLNDGWTHDRREQARMVRQFYDEELAIHFLLEEEMLFPLILRYVPDSSLLVQGLTSQHREMKNLVDGALTLDGPSLAGVLSDLGALLENHIRTEERELFPQFEESVPDDIADEFGKELEAREEALKLSYIHTQRFK